MQQVKLDNNGVAAIQFLEQLMKDDDFHDYLKTKYPNQYWRKENEIFPSENLFPTEKLGKIESGLFNLKKFLRFENIPLVKFN